MNARRIALTAVSIAIVTVLVASVPVPIPATGGFTHPGAVAEIFVAVAFGPIVGMVAAGVGAALADLILGYGSWAPLTLIAHGSLGLLAGWLSRGRGKGGMFAGWIAGGLALVALYFIGQATVYGLGVAGAAAELPINLFQVGLGVLGLGLYFLVRAVYPQIDQLAGGKGFTDVSEGCSPVPAAAWRGATHPEPAAESPVGRARGTESRGGPRRPVTCGSKCRGARVAPLSA